jgi:hypothetical protein
MDTGAWIGSAAIVMSALTAVYGAVNHKRIRSVCCSRVCVSSIDIEETTPTGPKKEEEPQVIIEIPSNTDNKIPKLSLKVPRRASQGV